MKDKAFFFAGFQGTTTRQTPLAVTSYLPTVAMRTGDFSAYINPANNCPSSASIRSIVDGTGKLVFPLSPAAVNVSARLPQTSDPCGKVFTGTPLHENQFQAPARLDYHLNDRHSLFVRYMATKDDQMVPYAIKPNDVLTSTGIGADDLAQSLAIGSTYILNPSVVNSFRISGNRVAQQKLPAKYFSPADVGVKNLNSYIPQFTSMLVAGGFSLGFPRIFRCPHRR